MIVERRQIWGVSRQEIYLVTSCWRYATVWSCSVALISARFRCNRDTGYFFTSLFLRMLRFSVHRTSIPSSVTRTISLNKDETGPSHVARLRKHISCPLCGVLRTVRKHRRWFRCDKQLQTLTTPAFFAELLPSSLLQVQDGVGILS